jgi:CRP-like cAMP-binding protein
MPEVPDVSAIAQHVKARIKQIEDQLTQHERLNDELERLRDALSRLEGAARSRVGAAPRGRRAAAKPAPSATRPSTAKRARTAKPVTSAKPARARAAAPRGQNKAKVLDALKRGGPMTASEIAKATGIGAATASTLLTKLAKAGELAKAERGYALPQEPTAAGPTPGAER